MNTSSGLLERIAAVVVVLDLASSVSCTARQSDRDANATGDLVLPGDRYYPESLDVAADGTLFVGSLALGEVVKFAPGGDAPTVFVAPEAT